MALDGDWKDDLDVTRVIQAPVAKNFVTQPDIPLESFNPLAYKRPSEMNSQPKVIAKYIQDNCDKKADFDIFCYVAKSCQI